MPDQKEYTLFGGDKKWNADDWTASDDRVRGGKSQSYLDCSDDKIGRFHGNLDIETLGGAGFASQRTTGEDREWDLSDYAGIQISIAKGDKKRYTFNLKDDLLPKDPETGREQSSISYECDFELPPQTEPGHTYSKTVFIPWKSFTPTYRGKVKKDAKPIDLKKVKRLSIMMRSFFGSQKGDFSLSMSSIKALPKVPSKEESVTVIGDVSLDLLEKSSIDTPEPSDSYFHARLNLGVIGVNIRVQKVAAYVILGLLSLYAVHRLTGGFWRRCQ